MAPSRIKFLDVQFPIVTKVNITLQVFTVVTVHDVVVRVDRVHWYRLQPSCGETYCPNLHGQVSIVS